MGGGPQHQFQHWQLRGARELSGFTAEDHTKPAVHDLDNTMCSSSCRWDDSILVGRQGLQQPPMDVCTLCCCNRCSGQLVLLTKSCDLRGLRTQGLWGFGLRCAESRSGPWRPGVLEACRFAYRGFPSRQRQGPVLDSPWQLRGGLPPVCTVTIVSPARLCGRSPSP